MKNDKVKSANGFDMEVVGISSVRLRIFDGNVVKLMRVGHAIKIKKNIISVG